MGLGTLDAFLVAIEPIIEGIPGLGVSSSQALTETVRLYQEALQFTDFNMPPAQHIEQAFAMYAPSSRGTGGIAGRDQYEEEHRVTIELLKKLQPKQFDTSLRLQIQRENLLRRSIEVANVVDGYTVRWTNTTRRQIAQSGRVTGQVLLSQMTFLVTNQFGVTYVT